MTVTFRPTDMLVERMRRRDEIGVDNNPVTCQDHHNTRYCGVHQSSRVPFLKAIDRSGRSSDSRSGFDEYANIPLLLTAEVSTDLENRPLSEEWRGIALGACMDMILVIDWHGDAAERIGLVELADTVALPRHHSETKLSWETVSAK